MKILLENIHKSYGKRSIVNRVSLSVAQGEVVGLLGPNGAGKTTTFYIATGLERPNQGKVWLDDRDSFVVCVLFTSRSLPYTNHPRRHKLLDTHYRRHGRRTAAS